MINTMKPVSLCSCLAAGAAAAAKSLQLCPTLQTRILEYSHQAPPSLGIVQARTLEWVAISFSSA